MRPNLITVSALFLSTMCPFANAQAPVSVASRLATQNALFNDSWQANLKMSPILGERSVLAFFTQPVICLEPFTGPQEEVREASSGR